MLLHCSKVDQCNSASDEYKSVDLLQAIRGTPNWPGMMFQKAQYLVKCCIKAGILDSEGNTNAVESSKN